MESWVIAVDLDKCLLNSANSLSSRNRQALETAVASGAVVVIASGRMWPAIRFILQQVPGIVAIVALNGALVLDSASGKVLFECSVPTAEVRALMSWCRHHNYRVMLCGIESLYVTTLDPVVNEYLERTRVSVDVQEDFYEIVPSAVYKALVYCHPPEPTDESVLADVLRRAEIVSSCSLYKSGHGYVEVVSRGVSKERGLMVALEALGLQILPLMAVGDGENDLGMLHFADCGYAVANACPEAKAAADIVVGDCDSDGVAEAIAHFMNKLKGG